MGEALLGRAEELRRLRGALTVPGCLVVVHGEAGVGKSALVRAALADESVSDHREGGALATLSWLAYLPLRRAFPDLPADSWTGDDEYAADAVESALGDRLLVCEDLHWADPGTLGVLDVLAGRARLLLTVRRGDAAAVPVLERLAEHAPVRLDLEPLAADDAATLARRVAPDLTDRETGEIVARSGGNPLLVEELAAADSEVASLELAVLARCRALPEDQLDGLATLALAGQPLPAHVLPAADGLVDAGLVRVGSDGTAQVRHALIGEVVDRLLSAERRARCHRALAAVLEHPGDVARHLLAAGDRKEAHRAAMAAFEAAQHPGERWRHLVTAAEAADGDESVGLRIRAAQAASRAGEPDEAERLLADLPDVPALRAAAAIARASTAFQAGDWHAYRRHAEEGMAQAEPGSEEELVLLARQGSAAVLVDNDAERGHELAMRARRLAERHGRSVADASKVAATALNHSGDPACLPLFRDAIEAARADGDAYLEVTSAVNLLIAIMALGDPREGWRMAEEMAERCRDLRLTVWARCFESFTLMYAGYASDHAYVVPAAERLLAQPLRPIDRLDTLSILAQVDVEAGRIARAHERIDVLAGTQTHLGNAHYLRALAYLHGGQPERALAERESFLAASNLDVYTVTEAAPVFAWAAWEAGVAPPPRPDGLPDVRLYAGVPAELAGVDALHEGRPADAVPLLAEAAGLHGAHQRRAALHCRWAVGEAMRLAGDPDAADVLVAAAERASDFGHVATVARCERSLRALGVRRPIRRAGAAQGTGQATGGTGHALGLSPREVQVVALAAEGLTDREIAARLGVAHRTVQTQLASARRKVGAENRSSLIAIVAGETG